MCVCIPRRYCSLATKPGVRRPVLPGLHARIVRVEKFEMFLDCCFSHVLIQEEGMFEDVSALYAEFWVDCQTPSQQVGEFRVLACHVNLNRRHLNDLVYKFLVGSSRPGEECFLKRIIHRRLFEVEALQEIFVVCFACHPQRNGATNLLNHREVLIIIVCREE